MTAISVPAGDYEVPLDIANAACDHLGATQITSFTQNSKVAARLSFRYDKVRKYELRRNIWRFSIRSAVLRPINTPTLGAGASVTGGYTMKFTPGVYDPTKTYVPGSVVSFGNVVWQAVAAVPLATEPDSNPPYWIEYFGPMNASPWQLLAAGGPALWSSLTNYAAGLNVVGSDGNVYLGLTNGNLNNNPVTDGGTHWMLVGPAASQPGYYAGDIVYYPVGANPGIYLSLVQGNVQQPGVTAAWVATQNYSAGQTVVGSDTSVYQSKVDLNIGIDPTTDAGVHWEAIPATQVDTPSGANWLQLGAASVSSFQFLYPVGSGPSSQLFTKNVYQLPNGFLREAPQDPKAGINTWLGGPANNVYDDWVIQDNFLITLTFTPIIFRFCADTKDVSRFDPMFCELFAARLALETAEVITQAADKKAAIGQEYNRWGAEARTVNGIETGSTEPAEDEYISVRR